MIDTPATNMSSSEGEKKIQYWKRQLDGASKYLPMPAGTTALTQTLVSSPGIKFTIVPPLKEKLVSLAKENSTSVYSILLAAYYTLLYRYTDQADIVILGNFRQFSICAEGNISQQGQILPLRTDLSGAPCFNELLQRVTVTVNAAQENWPVRTDLLGQLLQEKDTPLALAGYATSFSYCKSSASLTPQDLDLQESTRLSETPGTTLLALRLQDHGDHIEGTMEYDARVFQEYLVRQMTLHFQYLLEQILLLPATKISLLPLMNAGELHKILVEWNNTHKAFPDKCMDELFEEQVSKTPDAIAVQLHEKIRTSAFRKSKRALTYKEFNQRANQLANFLQGLGVGPEAVVGIYMKRSLELPVAIMGILKAGGAYLPIDPAVPKSRLDFMLKDSGIKILLTEHQLMHKLPPHELNLVCLDTEWSYVSVMNDQNLATGVHPGNLAYVIYTSGSTGAPKGTLVPHKGVVNYISWCTETYNMEAGSGCPVNSSIAFDATITSFFAPLCVGRKILLLPEEDEIEALRDLLHEDTDFSLVKITPAHLQLLADHTGQHTYTHGIKAMVIGGDALKAESLTRWREQEPLTRLINEYGPTETVVGCSFYEVSESTPLAGEVPIGKPIQNTQLYLLDKYLQPVPIGVTGEIYIGGTGVVRGYLNRPELTAERFLPDLFSNVNGERLYKTGDRGQYLPDGNIVFLGRVDYQVKIRGYRVELGELESVARQWGLLREVSAVVREDVPGEKKLVVYVVPAQPDQCNVLDLRHFLVDRLPAYMIPDAIVQLDAMPVNTNGKLDRHALPPPGTDRRDIAQPFAKPRNELEVKLCHLFEQVLRLNRIGVHDSLFDLGINSLQVYWIFTKLKETTGIQLPLSILFQRTTVAALAEYLGQQEASAPWSSLVPIQPAGSKPPLFCVHGGGGTVLFYRDLANNLGKDQPVYGLQPRGLDGKQRFHGNVEAMAAHYVKEIRTVDPLGPYHLCGYCFGGIVAFEMAQQLLKQGYKVNLLVTLNGVSPTYRALTSHETNPVKEKLAVRFSLDINEVSVRPTNTNADFVPFNWKYLSELNVTEKGKYLYRKIRNKTHRIVRHGLLSRAVDAYTISMYTACRKLGFPCPESLKKYYFLATNAAMVKAYKPTCYPGNLTVVRSPDLYPDASLGWKNYVAGEVITIDIPGKHKDRRQIMNEPFVQWTARELAEAIERCSALPK